MAKNTKGNLTQSKLVGRIQDMRAAVVKQMRHHKLTAYGLAKLTGITEQTLRNYVGGTHEMRSDKLARVFAAVGLEVSERAPDSAPDSPAGKRKRK